MLFRSFYATPSLVPQTIGHTTGASKDESICRRTAHCSRSPALALALLLTYGGFSDFRRSWLFILAGHAVFTLPFMVRSVLAVFGAIDVKTLDEGAASLGASPWRRFRDVIVPNATPGILAGSLMVVTLSLGEFNLTWMLHTPLTKTLPVGLADSYASMRLEVASAYTLVFFVMIIPLLVAMQIFAGYRRGPTVLPR